MVPNSSDTRIRINDLVVRYGNYTAVDHLNLQIYRGELFGLLGPNGAGKSTTIRVLIGQQIHTSGTVEILQLDIRKQWQQIKSLFGYVPDRDNLFDEFTGRRNLQIFASLYQVQASRINQCLEMVELSDAADVLVSGYSLGMKKKLLLARALLHNPPVLYLDEPTANLDIRSAEAVHHILKKHVQQGNTVILTTHNMHEVEKICDRVGIMCRGRLIALDSPLALRTKHTERRVDVILHDGNRHEISLDDRHQLSHLSEWIQIGKVASMHTREFDFHSTFLKLTGMTFE